MPYKYSDNGDQTNQDTIVLPSDDLISSISSTSSLWGIVQDYSINLYKDFSLYNNIRTQERVRSLHFTEDKLVFAGKTISISSAKGEISGKLEGHERTITCLDSQSQYLASGSADWSLRLWDLNKLQELSKSVINWNVVTSIKYYLNTIIQTSEDLRLRIWDVRNGQINVDVATSVGDNFANCCDLEGFSIVTGHRGFDGIGCEVKLWDLRKVNFPVLELEGHVEAVQGVKFVKGSVVSCGKDGKIFVFGADGKRKFSWEHLEKKPFCVMDRFKEGVLVGNVEPRVLYFSVDPLVQEM